MSDGVGSVGGNTTMGGPAQARSIVEGTLQEVAKQQAINRAPLKIPDARVLFGNGGNVNMSA